MDTTHLNETFAHYFVDQLIKQGVSAFCVSPGSRNTPILRAVAHQKQVDYVVHFDERGVGFCALGMAKASKKPVCLVVTSGSATANLLPAIMEAYKSYTPLIILTCDRPQELHDCGFNQTVSQTSMYAKYVKWETQILPPSNDVTLDYLKSIASQCCSKSYTAPFGPVHINFQFREPFFPLNEQITINLDQATENIPTEKVLSKNHLQKIACELSSHSKSLIVTGFDAFSSNQTQEIIQLSETLNFPILSDVLSGLRGSQSENIIKHHTLICSIKDIKDSLLPTCVIYFGRQYVSKSLLEFLSSKKIPTVFHIHESLDVQDPFHIVTKKIPISPITFCKQILPFLKTSSSYDYLKNWQHYSSLTQTVINQTIDQQGHANEAHLFHLLSQNQALKNSPFFLASSMPIRNADAYFYPKFPLSCFGLRGLSGIDGHIAVTVGIAKATQRKTLAIIGDLAALYDLNSLSMLSKVKVPIVLFVVNNQGGSIFTFKPIYEEKSCFDEFFATKHSYNFDSVCDMFGIEYISLSTLDSLKEAITHATKTTTHLLIELKTPYDENISFHKTISSKLVNGLKQHAFY